MRWRLTGNYGTFTIAREVEAMGYDAALEQAGIMSVLQEHGYEVLSAPDGEWWEAEALCSHGCGVCNGPMVYDPESSDGWPAWRCRDCRHWHISKDCCADDFTEELLGWAESGGDY